MGQSLNRLQALRGAACLTVIVYHIWFWGWTWYGTTPPVFGMVRWFGTGALDVFFVLSGFLIPYSQAARMESASEAKRFLVRRCWRLYPTYWAVLGLAAVGYAVFPGLNPMDFSIGQWLAFLTLLPPPSGGYAYVGPAHTLTYELAFYLVFAGVVALPRRAGVAVMIAWALAVVAAFPAYPFANHYVGVVLSPILLEILAGYAAFELVRGGCTLGGRAAVAVGAAWFVAVTAFAASLTNEEWIRCVSDRWNEVALFGPPATLLVYGLGAMDVRSKLSPGWMCRTGDAAYSLYLAHGPMSMFGLWLGYQLPHTTLWSLIWSGAMFAACVGAGVLVHFAIERPFLQLGKRLFPTRPRKAAPATDPVPLRMAA